MTRTPRRSEGDHLRRSSGKPSEKIERRRIGKESGRETWAGQYVGKTCMFFRVCLFILEPHTDGALQEVAPRYPIDLLDSCAFPAESTDSSSSIRIHDLIRPRFIGEPVAFLPAKHHSAPFQHYYPHTHERRKHSLLYIPNVSSLSVT